MDVGIIVIDPVFMHSHKFFSKGVVSMNKKELVMAAAAAAAAATSSFLFIIITPFHKIL